MNRLTVDREDGGIVTIDVIMGFEIEELGKKYVAYTLNDNGEDEDVDVLISEIDDHSMKSIPDEEINIVLQYYEEAKSLIEEN